MSIQKSRRVFWTGNGSSFPAALWGSSYLQKNSSLASFLVQNSQILDSKSFNKDDIIVLITYGWKRAEAHYITKFILNKTPSKLIVITGHTENQFLYLKNINNRICILKIFPEMENIFCRPSSVATSYILVAKLVSSLLGHSSLNYKKILEAWNFGRLQNLKCNNFRYFNNVILTTGDLLPSAFNICLSFREGMGLRSEVHEIESYGHGWYVPNHINISDTHYIILNSVKNDEYTINAVNRIMPLIKKTKAKFDIWSTPFSDFLGNIDFMSRVASLVIKMNLKTKFDINNPPGKEENREFHEII